MPKKEVINVNSCSTRGQQYELKVAPDSLPLKLCNSFWLIICRKAFFQSKHILPTIFWLYIPPFPLTFHTTPICLHFHSSTKTIWLTSPPRGQIHKILLNPQLTWLLCTLEILSSLGSLDILIFFLFSSYLSGQSFSVLCADVVSSNQSFKDNIPQNLFPPF